MVGIVETYEDIWSTYGTKHMPKYLNTEDKKSKVKIQIKNQRIKIYVMKDMDMVNNIEYIYVKIWGKCTMLLQNMIKHLSKVTVKHK